MTLDLLIALALQKDNMLLRLHPPHTCGLRRTRSHASPAEAPAFHWKGAGDGRGQAWLNAALETRGGYVTDGAGYQLFYADCGPEDGQPLVLIHGFPGYRRAFFCCSAHFTDGRALHTATSGATPSRHWRQQDDV